MAKTSYSIYLDYRKAVSQAERLEKAAQELRKEYNRMEDCYTSVSGAWKGDNANAYLAKIRKLQQEINRVEENITQAAIAVRRIARVTYDAEQRALELAKERTV